MELNNIGGSTSSSELGAGERALVALETSSSLRTTPSAPFSPWLAVKWQLSGERAGLD